MIIYLEYIIFIFDYSFTYVFIILFLLYANFILA